MKFVFSGADVFLKEKNKNVSASVDLDVNGDAVSNNTISSEHFTTDSRQSVMNNTLYDAAASDTVSSTGQEKVLTNINIPSSVKL